MLVETGPEDAENFLDVAAKVNFVNETVKPTQEGSIPYTIKEYVENYVWQVVVRCKQRRLPLEQEWLAIQRMTVLKHDEGQKYIGRSNAYLPVYARNRKTLVSNLNKSLFPSDEIVDATDMEQGDTEEAKAAKCVIEYEFENSGLRRTMKSFLGQFVDFGVSVIKSMYRTNRILKGKKRNAQAPNLDDQMGLDIGTDEGFTVSTRSIFNVVVYPESAESKRELQLEAERLEIPMSYVQAMHDEGRWLNVKDALATGSSANDEFDWVNTATLNDVAQIPNTMELRGEDGSPVESCIAVEVWCKIRIPPQYLAPQEDPRRPVPVRIVFINGVCVQARRNPFYHQESPFEYARDNQIVGSFYSDGAGHLTRDTQYLANDFVNQTNDCGIYGLNPVALINTNYFSGNIDNMKPGRAWKVRDIEKAMKFDRPPVEIVQYGMMMTDKMVSYGQDGAGAPPVLQGNKSSNTATGTQVLQHNANTPLTDTTEDIENDVMVPLMWKAWELSRQYRTQPFIRQLANGDLVKFLPNEINAKLSFRFLSSSQAANRQMRQQGILTFSDLAGKLQPNLQALGLMLDPTTVLKRVWNDGLGFRGFDKVVIPMPMMPMMPGAPGAPPMPPGQAPNLEDPTSAVGQGNVPGAAGNEPVGGEGEELKDIRAEVNAQTAVQGQQNAPGGLAGDVLPY